MDDAVVRVTDFRMAGFMAARGGKLLRTEIEDEDSKTVVFVFAAVSLNGNPPAQELIISYAGSKEERYDAACRSMQAMLRMALTDRMRNGKEKKK